MIKEGDRVRLSVRGVDSLMSLDEVQGDLSSEGTVVEDRYMGQVGVEFDLLRWEHMNLQDENIIWLWRDDLELVPEATPATKEDPLVVAYEYMYNAQESLRHYLALQKVVEKRGLL